MVISCISLVPVPEVAGSGFIEDLNSPDATYRDAVWHDGGDYLLAAGRDPLANGVVDKYDPAADSWQPVLSSPGDSYNGIAHTEAYFSYDGFESGENGWTTQTWEYSDVGPLVGRWKLDEGAGAYARDTSGNARHGTLMNMNNSNWVDGMDAKALKFVSSASNYIDIPNAAGLTSGGSFSGSCWINLTSHVGFGGIASNYDATDGGWGIWDQAAGGIRFLTRNALGNVTYADCAALSTGDWHNIAWVYNATLGTASFYVDGALSWSQPSVNPTRSIPSLTIGKYSGNYLNGIVDEMCIYDKALAPAEIKGAYDERAHAMGEWRFDEGSGSIANDTSQNEFDSPLMPSYPTNSPQWVRFSVSGSTLYFDGVDDAVQTGYIPDTFNIHDHSIEAWVFPVDSRENAIIYGVGEQGMNGKCFEMKLAYTNIEIWHWGWNWNTGISLPLNEWTHLVYTYNSSIKTAYIYVNNAYRGSFVFTGFLNVVNDGYFPGQIGASLPGRNFMGCIDELTIYNYTMPAGMVDLSYNRYVSNYFQNESRHGDWRFDEGFGPATADSGPHGNTGTLYNMEPGDWVPGPSGTCLVFDGVDEYVSCGNDASLGITDSGSVEAWVFPMAESNYARLVSKGNNYEISMDSSSPHHWYFWVSGGQSVTSASDVALNDWTHIAATYDGTQIRIYINGILENSVPKTGPLASDLSYFLIGQGSGYCLNGAVDQVKLWNRALKPDEVMASYRSVIHPTWHLVNPSFLTTPPSGTSHGSANHGTTIWWFGIDGSGDYYDDSRVSSSLISPVSDIPALSSTAAVVFSHWFEVEKGRPGYDRMSIYVKNVSDTGWHLLQEWDSGDAPVTGWRQEILPIPGWLGNQVQVNFTFDSVDGADNMNAGWHIDDFGVYSNDMYIAVGEPGPGGYSAYALDAYGTAKDVSGMNTADFNDVAPGKCPLSFMAVGGLGNAWYFTGYGWIQLTGAGPGDFLNGVDFNGTHFFIVGHDEAGHGVAYYYNEAEAYFGQYALHPIPGTPDWRLNAVAWTDELQTPRGYGLGAVAADGSAMSFCDPEMWHPMPSAQAPSARQGHAMAYDPDDNVIVLFGGYNGDNLGDTWIYNLYNRSWTEVFPVSSPPATRFHDMVYDTVAHRFVLFGGYPFTDQTWTYDYPENTWAQVFPGTSPWARCYHSMAFDESIGKTVLFGGFNSSGNLGDTWVYDGAAGSWIQMFPAISPDARCQHAMAYDTGNHRTVLFGGQSASVNAETWAYDAANDTWADMSPSAAPPARVQHSMSFDPASGRVVLFGGMDSDSLCDTWTYDLAANSWTDMFPSRRPDKRIFADMVYAANQGQSILFGGKVGGDVGWEASDTWFCYPGSPWMGDVVSQAKGMNGENLTAVAWNNEGLDAYFAGHNSTHGVLYSFYSGNDYLALAPGTGTTLAGHQLYALSYVPGSPSDELIALGGSAFKVLPLTTDMSTRLTVGADIPHVFDIDFRQQSTGLSRENQQVQTGSTYTFFVEANYTQGGVEHWNDASIAIAAWYDEGHVGMASIPDGSWVTTFNRTRQLGLNYDVGLGAAVVSYPVPNQEFTLHSFWEDPATYPGNRHRVYINVTFGPQTRAADGTGFIVGPTTGGTDRSLSFNDAYSWDYAVHVYDTVYTDAYSEMYEEFGVMRNVSISAAGNPTANAPPGASDNPMAPNSHVTYSSNAAYWVNVSIPHIYENGNILSPNRIGTGNVSVQNIAPTAGPVNSYISARTYFPSVQGVQMSIWGLNGTCLAPADNGTVSVGPWVTDYNAAGLGYASYTELQWWISVPASLPEGIYWAAITFTIDT